MGFLLLAIVVLAGAGVYAGATMASRSRTPEASSALAALDAVVPELQARHPGGQVLSLFGQATNGRIGRWTVNVWAPERRLSLYYVLDGETLLLSSTSTIDTSALPALMPLDGTARSAYLDSPEALRRAEEAAGRAYRARAGGTLAGMALREEPVDEWLWSLAYVGRERGRGLRVDVDARTGAILAAVEDPLRQAP